MQKTVLGLGFVLNLASKAINSIHLIWSPIRGPFRGPKFIGPRISKELGLVGLKEIFLKS